ncbi:Acyl-CoA ligase sidI [Metarhizium brunneum]|uniref:Acyl-CoA ligase sidI n=1 Tax=Metarhizium brunneum TaxID=500148 RepID=A0A7D5UXC2_9HYPO|nr:Acyl-CoA ligase sidI [Metarhizium brunneum]
MFAHPTNLSIVAGATDNPLWTMTLGELIETQAKCYGGRTAVVFPWQNISRTYHSLSLRSKLIAKALLAAGLQHGDCVAITAGNCYQYIEVFFGAARIGCPVVVLNSTYTPTELQRAVSFSECKIIFAAQFSGPKGDLSEHLEHLDKHGSDDAQLVLFDSSFRSRDNRLSVTTYDDFVGKAESSHVSDSLLVEKESLVKAGDVLNIQFTSGTTGLPKASMLTHMNLINNGKLVGDQLRLTERDVVCCPPPLFHCFGLVMGVLGAFTHGSSIVFPSAQFNADLVLDSIESESCTVLYGVPTMFLVELEVNKRRKRDTSSLQKALAAGALVPQAVVRRLKHEMNLETVLIAYGMTETSPVTFGTRFEDPIEQRLTSVGTVFPHTGAKIVDSRGRIVPRGVRGEICTSGYALQKEYLKNAEKTAEVMRADSDGVVWMHTGDEGVIDEQGYCRVTGRIKDMIIRGGENIMPTEIEERLLAHACVVEASVIGLPDERYGEAVACFLRQKEACARPDDAGIARWVQQTLGRHKAPRYVYWIGDPGVGHDFPKTGSGKHQKHILRDIGRRLLRANPVGTGNSLRARL